MPIHAFAPSTALYTLLRPSPLLPSLSTRALHTVYLPHRRVHISSPARRTATTTTTMSDATHSYQYDLLVLGAGSGGVRASRIAASYGAKVAIAERAALGGTCVNVGCVPKKLFVYGSHFGHDFHDSKAYGWDISGTPTLDWPRLIRNKNEEISRLNGIYGRLLDKAGVDLLVGTATFVDAHTIKVGEAEYTAEKILVAVGGRPFVPEFPGREHVITSNEAFFLEDLPKRVVIAGGGYIAVEFACIFNGFGSKVVQVYRGEKFLRGFDDEVREHLATEMRLGGVDVRFNADIAKIEKVDGGLLVELKNGERFETDVVMYATGRVPYTEELGLEKAGVETGKKNKILVDEWSRTNMENVFAVGDCTDRVNLTPVAIHEGHAFADTQYGGNRRNTSYEYIPTAVFSSPNIGTCGLTEEQAREKYGKLGVDVYKTAFRPMKHTLTKREGEKVFMKLIVEKETDKVVGCHILDGAAGEMIQLIGVAMKAGATKRDFDSTMPVHPVSAEEIVTLRTKQPDPK